MISVVLIDGPSGCGKTTIALRLEQQISSCKYIASTTFRPMRNKEVNGREHFFYKPAEFLKKKRNGEFLGYYEIYENRYGIEKRKILENPEQIKILTYHAFENNILDDLQNLNIKPIKILILPDDSEALNQRIIARNDKISQNAINERLNKYNDLKNIQNRYDFVIINKQNQLNDTIVKIKQIINDEL